MHNVRVFFKKSAEYRTIPVTGVWGGITPQGLVCCDLVVERAETPESVTIEVDEQSATAREVDRHPKQGMVVRESMVGLVMQPEVARTVGAWLTKTADEFEKRRIRGTDRPEESS